jgi:hypothetical protein
MSEARALYIEETIVLAIKRLLSGRVNEILSDLIFHIPLIEFGDYSGGSAVVPVIALSTCERTEKERILRIDAYSLNITFELTETPESELHCYAYSGAVSRAFYENPSLEGIADRTVIIGKKYVQPKKPNCGEGWGLVITLRIVIEGMLNAG